MQCVTVVEGQWLAELGPMFFSLKDSSTSKIESRKKYANEMVAMENEMRQAQEELEQKKKEKESAYISSRKTYIVTPGRVKEEDLKKEMFTPTPRRRFGL